MSAVRPDIEEILEREEGRAATGSRPGHETHVLPDGREVSRGDVLTFDPAPPGVFRVLFSPEGVDAEPAWSEAVVGFGLVVTWAGPATFADGVPTGDTTYNAELLPLVLNSGDGLVPAFPFDAGAKAVLLEAAAPAAAFELLPAERMALTVATAQWDRGDDVSPNVLTVCLAALNRIAGGGS